MNTVECLPLQPSSLAVSPSPAVRQYLEGLAPGSRRTMLCALKDVADMYRPGSTVDTCPWHEMRQKDTLFVRHLLSEQYAPATANKALCALRGVLKAAFRLRMMSAEDYYRAEDIPSVKGSRLKPGRQLTASEQSALFTAAATDSTPAGRRDAALLAIGFGCGLRRNEIANLKLGDYNAEAGTIAIKAGKGNKDRLVHLPANTQAAIDAWLAVRGAEPGPLLLAVNKGGKVLTGGVSASAIYLRVSVLAKRAGIEHFSPLDFRRTCISDFLDAGVDLSMVQRHVGHASPVTTASYDRRGDSAQRRAVARLDVPFVR